MRSDGTGIYNDLELEGNNENNVSKECIVIVFETIWNCRETDENNVFEACILTVFEIDKKEKKLSSVDLQADNCYN